MARPPLPPGMLEVYREVTWISPLGPVPALDAILDWLDHNPAEAASLLPGLAAFLKARRDL